MGTHAAGIYYGNSFVAMAVAEPAYFAKLRSLVRMKYDEPLVVSRRVHL